MKPEWLPLIAGLETEFFVDDDPRFTESLRELHTLDITSGLWAEVSGVRHPRVLELWALWRLPTATAAALALVPLTLSLWADEAVTPDERSEALATLQDTMFFRTIVQDLLNGWLDRRPGESLLRTWSAVVRALSQEVSPADRKLLADELLWASRSLSHRGKEEKALFDRLVQAFRP